MNREEAKAILSACRPDGSDAGDPRFAEALALLERDPTLRAWFEAEQAADLAIAAKLKAAPLPDDLLARIRSGTQARIAHPPRRPWVGLAMAAGFALLGVLAFLWLGRPSSAPPGSFAAYRADMAHFLLTSPRLDLATDRLPAVEEWLRSQHPAAPTVIPEPLRAFPSIGCRSVEWQGRNLALVCFMVEGQVVHLFVMPGSSFPDARFDASPQLARVGRQNTATWSSGEALYLLVTQADVALLKRLL